MRRWWRRPPGPEHDLIPDIVVFRGQLATLLVTVTAFEDRLRAVARSPAPDPPEEEHHGE
ncbi:MAG: hypothetical protein ACRDTZ_00365 [Pseudonocardiaceae bacterium]